MIRYKINTNEIVCCPLKVKNRNRVITWTNELLIMEFDKKVEIFPMINFYIITQTRFVLIEGIEHNLKL